MHFAIVIIFVAVWLLFVWIGSVALERTGLERSSARFQSLSALSGTGFTTSQAEKVVNHQTRRRIVSFLIILGNTGSVTFIVLMVLALRTGFFRPIMALVVLGLIVIAVSLLASRLRLLNWVTNLATGGGRSGTAVQVWHQGSGYSLVEVRLGQRHALVGRALKQMEADVQVLFIERADGVWAKPTPDDVLRVGDRLLCYGPSENPLISSTFA
jgi:hypothetical protein